jgi:uncharacterized membrane protein YeaQ/YmgE (transglycosylase-associated protein family)
MGLLIGIAFGIIAGATAKSVMPGPYAGGTAVAIPLGVVGALAGGALAAIVAGGMKTAFDAGVLIASVAGVLWVLFAYRCVAMRGVE